MTDLIDIVLRVGAKRQPTPAWTDADYMPTHWPALRDRIARATSEGELLAAAVEIAAGSDRLARVFVGGYQAALRALLVRNGLQLRDADRDSVLCLAATEAGGARPLAILTTLRPDGEGYVLQGSKQWTTGAGPGIPAQFLVVARRGERTLADGKQVPDLVLVRVDGMQAGVQVAAMPPTPFIPEVPHGRPHFEAVRVPADAIVPGDGYHNFLKPFRTTEDIFVMTSVAAYLLAEAQRADRSDLAVPCAAALVCLGELVVQPWLDPGVHLALAGVLDMLGRAASLVEGLWPEGSAESLRWQRDQALLMVAGKARAQRTQAAWERLS